MRNGRLLSCLALAAVALQGFVVSSVAANLTAAEEDPDWLAADRVLARIVPPAFPDQDFLIGDFGAVEVDQGDASEAIRAAIAACAQAGGGRVVVPPGRFLTGPIHLLSGVNLHLQKGATLLFKTDPAAYLPLVKSRWEGVECMNYSPLIYAYGQSNIAITGEGVLDGQASRDNWWPWKGLKGYGWSEGDPHQAPARARLFRMAEADVPVAERIMGEGAYLRPSFIQPYRCENVLIEGVTIMGAPMWLVHPVLCRNVTVRGVRFTSKGPNNDGCNPESSSDVLIEDCFFDTGDDCIAIKSGRNRDGRRLNVPSENIIIRNCLMHEGHGGVVIGSEISGGARNIFVENCSMDSPQLDRALRIKTNSVRGGVIEQIFVRNLHVGQVKDAVIRINFQYEEGDKGDFPPTVRQVHIRNLIVDQAPRVFRLVGYHHSPIRDIHLTDCTFLNVRNPSIVQHVEDLILNRVDIFPAE